MEKARKQRRRLSVDPEKVGDITHGSAGTPGEPVDESGAAVQETEVEKKARGECRFILRSWKGFVPYNKKKVNQDRGYVKFALGGDPEVNAFFVMDGHGEFGHDVSQRVCDELPKALAARADLKTNTPTAMIEATEAVAQSLNAQKKINISFSGSTLVFGVMVNKMLYVGNVGDSRCVLVQKKNGKMVAKGLSEDQKPDSPGEKERILAANGRVEPLPGVTGMPGEDCGPNRVWLANHQIPGLAMSRSIGDAISQQVGVIATPVITQHEINEEEDMAIIWASDGVWEFISNEEAVQIIEKHVGDEDITKGAHVLMHEARARWKKEEDVIDDITSVVLYLPNFGKK